jgi:hypothetical protein
MLNGSFDPFSSSLIASIKAVRPDVLPNVTVTVAPIPSTMPSDQDIGPTEYVQGIGEPINASFFPHVGIDPTGWYALKAKLRI